MTRLSPDTTNARSGLRRVELLVSVRHAAEAKLALSGGADWIDIKEPSRGSLGRADLDTIEQVMTAVGGRKPVSAAWGEWDEPCPNEIPAGLQLLKIGLARATGNWQEQLAHLCQQIYPGAEALSRKLPGALPTEGLPRLPGAGFPGVVVAYADYPRVQAPRVEEVLDWAQEHRPAGVLIDTAVKDSSCLFDWLDHAAISRHIQRCRQAGLRIALAGSLRGGNLITAARLGPDIVGVRGAACDAENRCHEVDAHRVKALVELLKATAIRPSRPQSTC